MRVNMKSIRRGLAVLTAVASILPWAAPARSASLPAEGTLADAHAAIIGNGGEFGAFVDNGGDLTGDGIADIVVGAPREESRRGRVYVFEGGPELSGTLDTTPSYARFEGKPCLGGDTECNLLFNDSADNVGIGGLVSDLDGDGNSDLIVTGAGIDGLERNSGGAYVFYGPLRQTEALVPDATFRGEARGDTVGQFELEVGDINGDTYPDLIIGAPGRGAVYIVHGTGHRVTGDVSLADAVELSGTPGEDGSLGRHMAIGELDGRDGSDLILCAETSLAGAGRCYILYGGTRRESGSIQSKSVSDASISGVEPGELLCCATAADLDGNGLDDVVITGPFADGFTGYSAIFYSDRERLDRDYRRTEADATISGNDIADFAGFYASAGDLNADGVDDLVLTALCENNVTLCDIFGWSDGAPVLHVFYGTAGAQLKRDDLTMLKSDVKIVTEHPGDSAGYWLEANGDVTGDGVNDLVVGAPSGCDDADYEDGGCSSPSAPRGATYVVAGGCDDPHKADHDKPKHCWK